MATPVYTYESLLAFFREVRELTIRHDSFELNVVRDTKDHLLGSIAMVSPDKLETALVKVDPLWFEKLDLKEETK